jgi:hypothetical protein
MAAYNKLNSFVDALCKKLHNLNSDTLKVALCSAAPIATNTQLSNLTQVANGNGYTTGGTATSVTLSNASGTEKLVCSDVVFTSVTGNMGPFRYAVLYNDTAANDELIGWWDYGSAVTLNGVAGETFTVDFDGTNGVFTLV